MKEISTIERKELKKRRRACKLTQEQLGRGIVTGAAISLWETGENPKCNQHLWDAVMTVLCKAEYDSANSPEFMDMGNKLVGGSEYAGYTAYDVGSRQAARQRAMKKYKEADEATREIIRIYKKINRAEYKRIKAVLWFLFCLDMILVAILVIGG